MSVKELGLWFAAPNIMDIGERVDSINNQLKGIQQVIEANSSVIPEYTESASEEVLSTVEYAFTDAVYAKDGYIYCIPRNISELCVLDPETLTVVDRITTGGRLNGTYDPDRNVIYLTRDYSIFEFDVATRTFNSEPIGSFTQKTTVVTSMGGKIYALPKGDNYSVQIYNIETGECELVPRETKVGYVYSHAVWGSNDTIWSIWRYPNNNFHVVCYRTKTKELVDYGDLGNGSGGPVSTPDGVRFLNRDGLYKIENGAIVRVPIPIQFDGGSHGSLVADGSIIVAYGSSFSYKGYVLNTDPARCTTFANSHAGICVTTPHYVVVVPHNNSVSNYKLTRVILNNFTKFSHEQCYSKVFNP